MNRMLAAAAALCTSAAAVAAAPAFAADNQAAAQMQTQTRPIDARVTRVKLDGIIDLKLRQGPVAQLIIRGSGSWLDKASTEQEGDTLTIDTEGHGMKLSQRNNGLQAELTLPQLREVVADGLGSTDIAGFSGATLALSLEGAGSMKVDANYRQVSATLGGLGSMNLRGLDADAITLSVPGAGYVTLHGRSKSLKATLAGLGGLDAQQFRADSVQLEMSGLGNATVYAHSKADLNLSGMGSVTVYGQPTRRIVSVEGLGRVSWK